MTQRFPKTLRSAYALMATSFFATKTRLRRSCQRRVLLPLFLGQSSSVSPETEGSGRHGDTMFDGDVLRAVAVDIIVRAGASVGRMAQGNAARIQSEMYAASGLQM